MPGRRPLLVVVAVLTLLAGALTAAAPGALAAAVPFEVHPSVNQLAVEGATPGDTLELVGPGGAVTPGTVDAAGSLLWRELAAGSYAVRTTADPAVESDPVTVTDFADPPPDQSLYTGQTLTKGFHYIETRDGTTLSVDVVWPGFLNIGGPYPVVVEYSGYDPSNPANTTMARLYNNLGFVYVGVNIRGTGCSGGSFLSFEPIQSLDGYDVIETVAAQSWAKDHQVGMVGISYPGISQLYVARTQPPSLAAITPLSVIDDTYKSTLYPGGILNTGFAVPWATERAQQAAPYGQGWEQGRVDGGDTTCAANQLLRLQNPDPLQLIEDNPFYVPALHDQVAPHLFAGDIDVPVFIAGAWQDEQTGGHFPAMLDDLTGSPHVYATMTNGSHTEALSPGVFGRYADFLDLYVAGRVPTGKAAVVAPVVAQELTGVGGLSLPPGIDYTGLDYAQALSRFEEQKPVRILFEEGAADGEPAGAPLPRFEASFDSWPIPSAATQRWFLTPGGKLAGKAPTVRPARTTPRSYRARPGALPATDYTGSSSDLWRASVDYDWRQIPRGTGLGWVSAPLPRTRVVAGSGSVDLWVRSATPDTDLEVTVSEVRPDGTEVYVQSGWLRASHRALDATASTATLPVHTDLASDARPMPRGTFQRLRVELFPFAHPFRKGSRIRVTVDAPGNARPLWAFDTISHGEKVEIATDRAHRSQLVLAVVPGVTVPAPAPACASLRSQPCRHYSG
ncbi:MAG: CocE/NonD family hydrolase [Nocardioidaceae bacterium]